MHSSPFPGIIKRPMSTHTKEDCHSITSRMTFYFLGHPCFSLLFLSLVFLSRTRAKPGRRVTWLHPCADADLRKHIKNDNARQPHRKEPRSGTPRDLSMDMLLAQNLQSLFSILKDYLSIIKVA